MHSGASGGRQARASPLRKVYITAAAVLAALVPIILLAGLWVRSELNESRRDVETFLASQAAMLSQRIDSDVQQELTVLQAVATLASLDGPDLPDFHAQATRMMTTMPEWAFMGLARADGEQIANTLQPLGGQLQALSPDTVRHVAETRRPAIYTPVASGGETIYPRHFVLLCVPVLRDGKANLVLVAGLRADHVQQLLRQQTQDERLMSFLVDEHGHILARSRPGDRSGARDADNLSRGVDAGMAGLLTTAGLGDENVLTTRQRSSLTGWLSVVATDRREFDAFSPRSMWATLSTGLLSLTLAAILAVFILYNIVERRVSKERLEASRALGDLDSRLLATTQDALAEQRKSAFEREVLLREIYHRVKNNLQIIQSLLRLGCRDLSEDQREPFENAVRRIGAMARVHTLLYNSPDLASIDFKDYLDGLVAEIADAFAADERGIETKLEAEPMRVSLDTAVPLAFIATELLTNAYKHAFPADRSGTIRVVAGREDGHGQFMIQDTGVGLPAGVTPRRPLGLTIVSKLVQQIGGTLEEPRPGESRFRVTFPVDGTAAPPPIPAPHTVMASA